MDAAIERLNALKLHEQHGTFSREIRNAQPYYGAYESNQEQENRRVEERNLRAMQEQYERKLKEQEHQFRAIQDEMQQLQLKADATEHQNHLLRSALGSIDVYKHKVADQELMIEQLQQEVKQLRLTNYRLQYVVQQNEPRGFQFLPPSPPDIF